MEAHILLEGAIGTFPLSQGLVKGILLVDSEHQPQPPIYSKLGAVHHQTDMNGVGERLQRLIGVILFSPSPHIGWFVILHKLLA
jgi:hypothetical protein